MIERQRVTFILGRSLTLHLYNPSVILTDDSSLYTREPLLLILKGALYIVSHKLSALGYSHAVAALVLGVACVTLDPHRLDLVDVAEL